MSTLIEAIENVQLSLDTLIGELEAEKSKDEPVFAGHLDEVDCYVATITTHLISLRSLLA